MTEETTETLADTLGLEGDGFGVWESQDDSCGIYGTLEEALSFYVADVPVVFSALNDAVILQAVAFKKDKVGHFEINEERPIHLCLTIQATGH